MNTTCPYCGAENDRHSAVGRPARPEAGDVSLCIKCTEPSIYTAEFSLRKPTDAEASELASNPLVRKVRSVMKVQQMQRARMQ